MNGATRISAKHPGLDPGPSASGGILDAKQNNWIAALRSQ